MAKNFKMVSGIGTDGTPVMQTPSSRDVDIFEEFFDAEVAPGLIYKETRHVVRVSCPRGFAANNESYAKQLSYDNGALPMISYIDLKTGKMLQETSDKFCEWLGKDWVATEAPESEETKKANEVLLKMAVAHTFSADPDNAAPKIDESKKDEPNWTRMKQPKTKRRSKK